MPKHLLGAIRHEARHEVSPNLVGSAAMDAAGLYARLATRPEGLTNDEAVARLARHGPNVVANDQRAGVVKLLWHAVLNPLAVLATVSFATGDPRAGSVMSVMIVLGVGLKLIQQAKADNAAAKLKRMISITAMVLRDGRSQEIAVSRLVPDNMVILAAGDMIPGDVRVVVAKDLFVNQGALTGESCSVEKFEIEKNPAATAPIELSSIASLGTSVESGSATAVIVATGKETLLGGIAESLSANESPTAFDQENTRFPRGHLVILASSRIQTNPNW